MQTVADNATRLEFAQLALTDDLLLDSGRRWLQRRPFKPAKDPDQRHQDHRRRSKP